MRSGRKRSAQTPILFLTGVGADTGALRRWATMAFAMLVIAIRRGSKLATAMEARGFIFGGALAARLNVGFVPVRKPGKLPGRVIEQQFSLEYGHETLTMLHDALWPGARVMIVDDVLATGGTIAATASLIKKMGAELVHVGVLLELGFLPGRAKLAASGIDTVSAVLTV